MTYNPNIPQSTDNISVSQGNLLTNFQQINALYGTNSAGAGVPGADHVAFNDATSANRGLHKKVTFTNVTADPSNLIGYPNSILYTKTFGSSPNFNLELYFSEYRQNAGSGQLINLVPTVKAIAQIKFNNISGNQPIQTTNTLSSNVSTVNWGGAQAFTVTFSKALDYSTYYVFYYYLTSGNGLNPFVTVAGSQLTTGFQFTTDNTTYDTNDIIGFMVI